MAQSKLDTIVAREYLERVRLADAGYLSVPFAEDVELSMRLG